MTIKQEIVLISLIFFPLVVGMLSALLFGIYGPLFLILFSVAVTIVILYKALKIVRP